MNSPLSIFERYFLIVILISFFLFSYFSNIIGILFTKISYIFLNIFFDVTLLTDSILWQNHKFLVVDECIGISAYIMLTFLFFSMPTKKDILVKSWVYSLITFTIANLIRIIFLMTIFIVFGENIFDKFHLLFYQILTGVMLAVIFIYYYKRYNIKEKPLIDDYLWIFSFLRKRN